MPLSKAGKKIKAKLEKHYGEKKGEGIFYAMENKGEIPGMNKMKSDAKGSDTKAKKKKEPEAKDPALEYLRALRSGETDEERLEMLRRLAEASTMSSERPKVGMAKGGMVKGYNVGGMVRATGTLNTGIRKCGE